MIADPKTYLASLTDELTKTWPKSYSAGFLVS